MYGGVSLAVYMNGIAQELLSLVRSTASDPGGDRPETGSLRVYQELASHLSRKDNGVFGHRFVVDIVSGTSAGGINGVCLAKGLVRGIKDLKTLEKTWLDDGDIDTLLNDRRSEPGQYNSKEPKTSLFNSQRMYGKLLDAFSKMEENANEKPHVESMDLFVTTTDLRGRQLPVLLSGGRADEHLHKHVFPFSFRAHEFCDENQLNHFTGEYDPMLAFASRCTSSFPIAFEPVTIENVMTWMERQGPHGKGGFRDNLEQWKALFFSAYGKNDGGIQLEKREFADGGYLDNRPFGHAINSIHAREADCPIVRKLLFIDPSPENMDLRQQAREISFLENSVLASVSLPRYETIREEIDAIARRNDWIETVNGIMEHLRPKNVRQLKSIIGKHFQDFYRNPANSFPAEEMDEAAGSLFSGLPGTIKSATAIRSHEAPVRMFWSLISQKSSQQSLGESRNSVKSYLPKYDDIDLQGMTSLLGGNYIAYHYTRLDTLTEELSLMITGAMNAELHREISRTVRQIVGAWRKASYVSLRVDCGPQGATETENLFFRYFDIDFRIRRMNFFRIAIQKAILERSTESLYFGLTDDSTHDFSLTDSIEAALTEFYHKTVSALRSLYRLRSFLHSGPTRNPLVGKASSLRDRIETLLAGDNQAIEKGSCGIPLLPDGFDGIAALFDGNTLTTARDHSPFKLLVGELMSLMHDIVRTGKPQQSVSSGHDIACEGTEAVSNLVYAAFGELGNEYPELAGRMRYVYDFGYDLFDSTWLPLLSGGEFGEGTMVDVIRISPVDSPSLWDEGMRKLPKLAGVSLGSFGGFLEREWRRNDIMWGRLDAAERIISTLLPGLDDDEANTRKELILKAQHAILLESLSEWMDGLERSRHSSVNDGIQYKHLKEIRDGLANGPAILPRKQGEPVIDPSWKKLFINAYDFNRELEPAPTLQRIGRSSAILSSMINRLDGGGGIGGKISGYLKKLSWILLGMLDFSTPRSLPEILGRYWLHLGTLVSIVLLIGGTLFGRVTDQHDSGVTVNLIGISLLLVVGIIWLVRYGMETFIIKVSKSHRQRQRLQAVAAVVALVVFITLFLAAETFLVYGNSLLNTFMKGFLAIAKQQSGWLIP
jgi:predicted acylesterase/phospholipase RssA